MFDVAGAQTFGSQAPQGWAPQSAAQMSTAIKKSSSCANMASQGSGSPLQVTARPCVCVYLLLSILLLFSFFSPCSYYYSCYLVNLSLLLALFPASAIAACDGRQCAFLTDGAAGGNERRRLHQGCVNARPDQRDHLRAIRNLRI